MNTKKQKQALLDQLYEPYKKCMMCPLARQGRTKIVFGQGNPNANIMFIGEGPGQKEDEQGVPFVGRSGKLLTTTLESIGVSREDVFITNIVKCRPPNNRKPSKQEAFTCKNLLLLKQIHIIQPRVICTLGAAALEEFAEEKLSVSSSRGITRQYENFLLIPTYHPAYILRNKNNYYFFKKDIQTAIKLIST